MGFRLGRGLAVGASLAVMVASMQGVAQAGADARIAAAAPEAAVTQVGASGAVDAAAESRTPGPRMTLTLSRLGGEKLSRVKLEDGSHGRRLVVKNHFLASGEVPDSLRGRLKGGSVHLQNRYKGLNDPWHTLTRIPVERDGSFAKKVWATRKDFLHQREYRAVATVKPRFGTGWVSAAATSAESNTVTANGVVAFTILMQNTSGDDLNVTVPAGVTSGNNYVNGTFKLADNEEVLLTYTNTPPQSMVSWSVTKQNCFGKRCTTYRVNWDYSRSKSTSCQDAAPKFTSGNNYLVQLKPQFGSGYNGYLTGPNSLNCTFDLAEKFDNWIEKNPAKGFAAIYVAVLIIAIVIAAVIITGGGAAVGIVEGTAELVASSGEAVGEIADDLVTFEEEAEMLTTDQLYEREDRAVLQMACQLMAARLATDPEPTCEYEF